MMIQLDKMGYQDIRIGTAVNTEPLTAVTRLPLSSSVKRFDEAMVLDQGPAAIPDTTGVPSVAPIEKMSELRLFVQRSLLRQIILHGVKPETDEE